MKFRFCGDQDCPDWFLTQMVTLSRLSSVKAKLVTQHVVRHLLGQDVDVDKMNSLVADLKLSQNEAQSLLSSLEFILSSASRFSTSEQHLRAELQQVGLPKETAAAISKVHQDSAALIRDKLIESSLRINRLENVSCRLAENNTGEGSQVFELDLLVQRSEDPADKQSISLHADAAKMQVLLSELERVRDLINQRGLAGEQ